MNISFHTAIGKNQLVIECDKMSELHKWGGTYGAIPKKCDCCGSENLILGYKNPGGYDYFSVDCLDCGATANFGQKMDKSGLFWKGDKMEVYQGKGTVPPEQDPSRGYAQPQGPPPSGLPLAEGEQPPSPDEPPNW